MNYYAFHIGDYASATAHLSIIEDGVYRRLLDIYYTREAPIPADMRQAYRLVRAQSDAEREAVDIILDEFFTLTDDGWRHARCDAEIARANEKKRKASQSANVRWSNAKSDEPNSACDANDDAGALPSECERNANASEAPCERIDATCEGNAPNPNPNPNPNPKERQHSSGKPDLQPGFERFWSAWPKSDRKVAKAECAKRWKARGLEAQAESIVSHVEAMKGTRQWREGFDPAPLTYLNQRRWEDGESGQVQRSEWWLDLGYGDEAMARKDGHGPERRAA